MSNYDKVPKVICISFTLALVASLSLSSLAQPKKIKDNALIKGNIFIDNNKNSKKDSGEKGLSGVSVSNGKEIVITDINGNYSLPLDVEWRISDMVYITVPSGYSVSTNQAAIPMFFRNLGELNKGETVEVNFPLFEDNQSSRDSFTFATFSDVHVGTENLNRQEEFSKQIAQVCNNSDGPSFIINTGDLTSNATPDEFSHYLVGSSISNIPIWPVIGNHEFYYGDPESGNRDWTQSLERYPELVEHYRKYIGPEWYSFDYGQYHFVALENTLLLKPDQFEWMKKDLELNGVGKKIVLLVHSPLNVPWSGSDTEIYLEILKPYDVSLILAGHSHSNEVVKDVIPGSFHMVTNGTSETLDLTPRGYRIINMTPDTLRSEFRMYDVEKKLVLVNPSPFSKVDKKHNTFQINYYDSSNKLKNASYKIDDQPWRDLQMKNGFTWIDSNWDTRNLKIGKHYAMVKVTDMNNKITTHSCYFDITEEGRFQIPRANRSWPMFHGSPDHVGYTKDSISASNLQLSWSHITKGSILTASPIIVGETVYATTRDENGVENASILALDLKTGKTQWKFKASASVVSTPAYYKDLVISGTLDGELYALDAKTGDVIWHHSFKTHGPVSRTWMYYSPTIHNGILYQGFETGEVTSEALFGQAGSYLGAFEVSTGKLLWSSKIDRAYMNEASPAVYDGKVYIGSRTGTLACFDTQTGEEIWKKQAAGGESHSSPAVANGRVFMGFYSTVSLASIDANTGEIYWQYTPLDKNIPGHRWKERGLKVPTYIVPSSPAYDKGNIFMGFMDGSISSFDEIDGNVNWTFQTNGAILSSPAISGNTVFIGSADGFIYGLDKGTGKEKWKYEIGTWVASSPAISGNTLVIGSWDGNIYAFTEIAEK